MWQIVATYVSYGGVPLSTADCAATAATTVVSRQRRALDGGRRIRGGYERWGVGVGVIGLPSVVPVHRAGVEGELE